MVIRARGLVPHLARYTLAIGAGATFGYILAAHKKEAARTIQTTTFADRPTEIQLRANGRIFDITVPSQHAKSTHALLELEETERFLTANERSVMLQHRPMNPIIRWDTNILPANPVCEDRIAVDFLERGDAGDLAAISGPFWPAWREIRTRILDVVPPWTAYSRTAAPGLGEDDIALFSVLDGHEGTTVVDVISKTLHAAIVRALGAANFFGNDDLPLTEVIERTYLELDADIIEAPFSVACASAKTPDPESCLPAFRPSDLMQGLSERLGTTALTAIIDGKADAVHILNVGDCRAVAGWYNPLTDKWRTEVLNSEHRSSNPEDRARLYQEHPGEEDQNIVVHNLGMPLLFGFADVFRVFGDSHLKRSAAESRLVEESLETLQGRPFGPYLSPPYLTAKPDVVAHLLRHSNGDQMRFLILGTDGLWTRMTPEEACLLVAAHNNPVSFPRKIDKADLHSEIPFVLPHEPRPWPQDELPCTTAENTHGSWMFTDADNAATHLIRNCISRGDEDLARVQLSARGGLTRQMRDDTAAVSVHQQDHGLA